MTLVTSLDLIYTINVIIKYRYRVFECYAHICTSDLSRLVPEVEHEILRGTSELNGISVSFFQIFAQMLMRKLECLIHQMFGVGP